MIVGYGHFNHTCFNGSAWQIIEQGLKPFPLTLYDMTDLVVLRQTVLLPQNRHSWLLLFYTVTDTNKWNTMNV